MTAQDIPEHIKLFNDFKDLAKNNSFQRFLITYGGVVISVDGKFPRQIWDDYVPYLHEQFGDEKDITKIYAKFKNLP